MTRAAFTFYIGIDYSGAKTANSSLKGLRVYMADRNSPPKEVLPPPSPRWYWTRKEVAQWLVERLNQDQPIIVGIDHGFSFPIQYFIKYDLPYDWPAFLNDFQRHWPTNQDHTPVDFVRNGTCGNGTARSGDTRWRRITEKRASSAKSVFHFDVPSSVAKSTHAGLPWLRYIRQQMGGGVHFWPFDGWDIPPYKSTIVEVYPALWSRGFARENRTDDQHDAYSVVSWLQKADRGETLSAFFTPSIAQAELKVAKIEGWILGIM